MSCLITDGFTLDCNDSVGGIDEVYIANGPITSITASSGNITAMMSGTASISSASFFKFELPKQTASFTETVNVSQENGTLFYNQDLTLVFNKMEAEKRNQLLLMAKSPNMVVVFKTNEGTYFTVGIKNGAFISAGSAVSGTTYGDRNGYEITISGIETEPSYTVASNLVVGS